MNIFNSVKQFSDQINGQFTEYDNSKAVVVVPTTNGRFQTVLLTIEGSKSASKQRAVISSKVCEYSPEIDLKKLLEQNSNFDYSRFILEDGHLKIEASCLADTASDDELMHMVQEVAKQADSYEFLFTGKDIN